MMSLSQRTARIGGTFVLALLAMAVVACAGGDAAAPDTDAAPAAETVISYDPAILDVAGRSEDDHYRDGGFKPLEVYGFFGVEPGMTVVDLSTAGMYNAHILAQIVGPEGKVIATTTYRDTAREGSVERTQGVLDGRNVDGVLSNVEIVATLEDIPDNSIDVLITVRNYHDFGERADRVLAVPRLLRVLKPGGILGAIDAHTDKTDERDESVHRMNEDMAREEIEIGGFEFLGNSELLYNDQDTFDFDGRAPGDPIYRYYIQRWTLKFRKPMN
jgi:predicted methyltransferase